MLGDFIGVKISRFRDARRASGSETNFPHGDFTPATRESDQFPSKSVYTANLCPLSGEAEFANLGENFGEAIGESIEAASRGAIRQGPTEHLDGVLGEEQRVDDAVQSGPGRNC